MKRMSPRVNIAKGKGEDFARNLAHEKTTKFPVLTISVPRGLYAKRPFG